MSAEEHIVKYEDFVIGIANRTAKFEIKNRKLFSALFFDKSVIWLMRFLLFMVGAPIIAIPVFCIILNNWWLLFGFIGIFFGNIVHSVNAKTSKRFKNLFELFFCFLFLLGGFIYFIGILQPFVFAFACLTYSFFFLDLSDGIYDEIASKNVIKSSRLYYYSVENNIITVR
jgi:hypothetical protein